MTKVYLYANPLHTDDDRIYLGYTSKQNAAEIGEKRLTKQGYDPRYYGIDVEYRRPTQ